MWACAECLWKSPLPVFPFECLCGRYYRSAEEGCTDPPEVPQYLECKHRGEKTGEEVSCSSCGNRQGKAELYWCHLHGEAVTLKRSTGRPEGRDCLGCLADMAEMRAVK